MSSASSFIDQLGGGRRQSIGNARAVARSAPALAEPSGGTVGGGRLPDPLVCMRAVANPEVLRGRERHILDVLASSDLPEERWHVGLLIPRLHLDREQQAAGVLARLLDDPSRIAQANALTGIVLLAQRHCELAQRADDALARAARSRHASVRARARRLTTAH